MAAVKNITAVVSPRRTVMVGNKFAGPGEEVSLPSDEVAELRASGFLVDPAAPSAPPTGEGPSFDIDDPTAVVVTQG